MKQVTLGKVTMESSICIPIAPALQLWRLNSPLIFSQVEIGKIRKKNQESYSMSIVCACVYLCTVVIATCKLAATLRNNPDFTFRYYQNSYITQRYYLLNPHTLLQSWQKFFNYICSLHSATVSRKEREKMITWRRSWKVDIYQVVFFL